MNYEEACAALKRKPATLEDFKKLPIPEDQIISLFGEHKLVTCNEVMNMKANEGKKWIIDFLNLKQDKWRNYFWAKVDKSKPSGVGFSFNTSDYGYSLTTIGSRLYFISQKVAIEAGNDPDMVQYANEWIS